MKTFNIISFFILLSIPSYSQKYLTKTGHIWFVSNAPLETIEAHNRQVNVALNTQNADFIFKVLIKSFEFKNALMQQHFNENYMESDKYPEATFKGKIVNISEINFSKDGSYPAVVEGEMTIHGVTQKIKQTGVLQVKGSQIIATSVFTIALKDYNITIPTAVVKKIAEVVQIQVNVTLNPVKK